MLCEVVAEVQPGAMSARTTLGELLKIPRKVANYLRENLEGKSVVCFLATKCAEGLAATRVIRIVGSVAEFVQGGIVLVTMPNTAKFHRAVEVLHGYTFGSGGSHVLIEGEAMRTIVQLLGFRSGPWVFKFYLEPKGKYTHDGYKVTEPTQVREFLGRPVSIVAR